MNTRISLESPTKFPDIEWFLPERKKLEYAITIPNDNCLHLNTHLRVQIPKHITIGVSEDGKTLWLEEKAEGGYSISKSGTIKASNLIDAIKARGIGLPARYVTTECDNCWTVTLVSPVSPSNLPKKTPKKPRINGLKTMLPLGEIKNA